MLCILITIINVTVSIGNVTVSIGTCKSSSLVRCPVRWGVGVSELDPWLTKMDKIKPGITFSLVTLRLLPFSVQFCL